MSNLLSGFFGALLGAATSFLAVMYAHRLDVEHERKKEVGNLKSWLNGLQADILNITSDIGIAQKDTSGIKYNQPCMKRVTLGFMEAATLGWCEFDQDGEFFQCLSKAFADASHTNKMLDHFAGMASNVLLLEANKPVIACSLKTTLESVNALKQRVEGKLALFGTI
ncbi:MAG TPA: hypothetical protein VHX86_13980 [Tepidisphaeraceae bacterium]|jgi:hypothetical protein|nr:hypothetical protein [Tepidisphaeraceae bacterium]